MLGDKIDTGIKLAARNNDYIIFWTVSNDFIWFFKQVIHNRNPNKRQIYGITSYLNGNNANFYLIYDEINNNFNI